MTFNQVNNNNGGVYNNTMRNEMIIGNTEAPHTAVVRIAVEVHDNLPTGELSGRLVGKRDLLVQIKGETKSVCLARLDEFLNDAKRKFQ